jgi:hypothetical protein
LPSERWSKEIPFFFSRKVLSLPMRWDWEKQ